MPLLRKQQFERTKPPTGLKPEDEVFYCEATNEVFNDYEAFFDRTILCNSLVWSCAVTGKGNLTYEEAVESEEKAKKRISNLPKPLKKGLLWLTYKTKRGRVGELVDDVYDWSKGRYFVGETVEAVIGNQWCESKITRVIPPSDQEIQADAEEITEVEQDGSPKKNKDGADATEKPKIANPPDHLYKYEVEETEPDDEDMVELHVIEADDIKREKGVLTRDKLSLYLKNVVELDGVVFKLKPKAIKLYNLDTVKFAEIFAGPEPEFEESIRKVGVMVNKKKGQFTLDGWATSNKGEKKPSQEKKPPQEKKVKPEQAPKPPKPPKQTPEELEAEMKKLREAQAKYREDMRIKAEEMKKKRIEDKQKEKERKAEEKRLVKEIMQEWNSRRDDLDCADHKELPTPTPVRCRIPNHLVGDFLALLEFLHSFSDILEVKDSYPGTGVTFPELESALVETEALDGAFYDIVSFMLVTLFDLQLEEEEEARADTDKTATDELHEGLTGKNQEIANAIRAATMTHLYTKKNLGLTLREVHLDQWSITEVLRLHLESSGAYRGNNLQNWRYQQRGGWRLQDDPGFQFCLENPQILASLQEVSIFDLGVTEKVKLLSVMMNQMLSFAGVRDEVDTRMENVFETRQELKDAQAEENKRLREVKQEEWNRVKEERQKIMEERLKEAENKKNELEKKLKDDENKDSTEPKKEEPKKDEKKEAPVLTLTTRQQEAAIVAKAKEEEEKVSEEENLKADWLDREAKLNSALSEYQRGVAVHCLGRDRAFRRFWVFDSVPGVFVEHDDDQIGGCREEPTPWDPEAVVEPLNEEQATKKAREMMEAKGEAVPASPSSDKENKSSLVSSGPNLAVGEVGKTYSKKAPVLKQKVLGANNGSLSVQKEEEAKPMENGIETTSVETEEVETKIIPEHPPWGRCLANGVDCPVHSNILPKAHWAFYSTMEEIDDLVEGLNSRGVREGELKERILSERERIEHRVKKCKVDQLVVSQDDVETQEKDQLQQVQDRRDKASKYAGLESVPIGTSLQEIVGLSLRDQILELEEKIWVGSLGSLKVKNRDKWVNAISKRSYEMGADTLVWGEGDKVEMDRLVRGETRPGTPDTDSGKRDSGASNSSNSEMRGDVRQMAAAILQVGQMIADKEKFLKQPLGEDEKEKKKRLKREEDEKKWKEQHPEEEEEDEEMEVDVKVIMTAFKRWEKSLMSSTNFGQLFIHLTTLDNSIIWSKSIMNTKCKICRRKTDSDNMLLCDSCDNGHHIYCLKPKLKKIPSGDWFCPECKPKERVRSPKKKMRKSFSVADATDDEEDQDETPPKKKGKSRKKIIESEEESEEEEPLPKKKGKGKKKVVVSEEEEEDDDEEELPKKRGGKKKAEVVKNTKGKKKGGLANLLGKRGAAKKAEQQMRGLDDTHEEDDDEDEEEEEVGKRGRRGKKSQDENKENARSKSAKRARNLDDSIDLNVVALEDIVKGLLKHRDGWPFDRPITKADAPDYHLCVRTPMDLDTIRQRLNDMYYTNNQAVINDIRLVFSNCVSYNMEDAEEYGCAERLDKYFDSQLKAQGLVDEEANKPRSKKRRL
eukprot:GFUD01011387.1.p1 GENE.GFUD01011387.1~~GFUD01011387.1.p1  ORF type:complete len:1574 (+),score=621.92 GFUD01011387.1:101-4822(+)